MKIETIPYTTMINFKSYSKTLPTKTFVFDKDICNMHDTSVSTRNKDIFPENNDYSFEALIWKASFICI